MTASTKSRWCMDAAEVRVMLSEEQIRKLLSDIKSAYLVGYFKDDLDTEAEKWGQIQILEWILSK